MDVPVMEVITDTTIQSAAQKVITESWVGLRIGGKLYRDTDITITATMNLELPIEVRRQVETLVAQMLRTIDMKKFA